MDDLIYSYTDKEAVNDGFIHVLKGGHRVTNNAFEAIKQKYNYEIKETLNFILCELLPLIPYADKEFKKGGILSTDFNFKVGKFKHSQILWFIPNENNGITIMRPEDY